MTDPTFKPSDTVIEAARELRDALMEDSPFGESEMGEDWFLREFPEVAALSEVETAAEEDHREPCGECHLQPGETCDICGAFNPPAKSDSAAERKA